MAINPTRITGMATGMDTDATIKQMLKPYQMRVDKVKQDRQIVQWRQDIFREILGELNTFKSTYFDVLKPETNMLSARNYSSLKAESSDSKVLTATVGVGAVAGNYKVNVTQMAKSATISGSSLKNSVAMQEVDLSTNAADLSNKDIKIVTGSGEEITINLGIIDGSTDLQSVISGKLSDPRLQGKLSVETVQNTGSKWTLKFKTATQEQIKIQSDIPQLGNHVINPVKYTKLSEMGVSASTITLNAGTPILININPDMTIQELNDKINQASKGTIIGRFSELTGEYSFETKATGSSTNLAVSGTGNLLDVLKVSPQSKSGQDAIVKITPPGGIETTVTKSSNNFTIDDINYNILTEGNADIALTTDTQQTFDKIVNFINKYNEVVDKMTTKVEQKRQYTYTPLTEEQKKDMSEDQIKMWEDKAKEGLLKGDSSLENMLNSMRRAFFDKIEGSGISLTEIGLTTSKDTSQRGKIILDTNLVNGKNGEQRLKDAIKNKGEQLSELFMKRSEVDYNPDATQQEKVARYNSEGIFQRINDILTDYTRNTRNNNGKKGFLIEKAGIKGDLSEIKNMLTEDLNKKDKTIKDLEKKLHARETKLYSQFAQLEKAMNQMNAQSTWLAQQLGGGK
jgi:flagellar hook-associated protein 2